MCLPESYILTNKSHTVSYENAVTSTSMWLQWWFQAASSWWVKECLVSTRLICSLILDNIHWEPRTCVAVTHKLKQIHNIQQMQGIFLCFTLTALELCSWLHIYTVQVLHRTCTLPHSVSWLVDWLPHNLICMHSPLGRMVLNCSSVVCQQSIVCFAS